MHISQQMAPGLKLLRGDMFSEKQWAGMLDLIGVPYQSIETIKFKEFLQAREQIIQNYDHIKVRTINLRTYKKY